MQHKNKIIIGLTSLLLVVAVVLTIKSKVVIKNNEIMEGPNVSNESEANEASTEKDADTLQGEESSSNDSTSNISKVEESKKDNVKDEITRNSEKYSSENLLDEEEGNLKTSNDASNKEDLLNKEEETISNIFSKANNFLVKLVTGAKDKLFNNAVEENNNQYAVKDLFIDKNQDDLKEDNSHKKVVKKTEDQSKKDTVSSASKEKEKETNTIELTNNTDKKSDNTFIEKSIIEKNTKLVDLGWVKYIVVTFNQGSMNDYDLYVLDNGSYKAIKPSKVDDSGKVVKWEIDKLGYNMIKVKNKKSGEEGTYKFAK